MHAGALRALEFDRIVSVVTGLAVTPLGERRLGDLHPMTETAQVVNAQSATTEGVRFLGDLSQDRIAGPRPRPVQPARHEKLVKPGHYLEPL